MEKRGANWFRRGSIPPTRSALALVSVFIGVLAVLLVPREAVAEDNARVPAAIADFDNLDTSGESSERTAAHAERVLAFAGILRDTLAEQEKFEIVELVCPSSPCSVSRVRQNPLMQAARDSGARVLVYGGIQKMSTLVQFGFIEAIDLKTGQSVFSQAISFRGDTDEAFRRAALYVSDYLNDVPFAP